LNFLSIGHNNERPSFQKTPTYLFSIVLQSLTFSEFGNLPILDQVITLWWLSVPYRNMHFEPADFLSFTNRILKNAGIQKL